MRYEEIIEAPEIKDETKSALAGRDFLEWWKWDSIGAACVPKCGGCGNCQPDNLTTSHL